MVENQDVARVPEFIPINGYAGHGSRSYLS